MMKIMPKIKIIKKNIKKKNKTEKKKNSNQ